MDTDPIVQPSDSKGHYLDGCPKDVHGVALYAPTLWLNGWHIPWRARLFEDSYHIVTIDRQRHVVVDRTVTFIGQVVSRLKERAMKPAQLRPAAANPRTGDEKAA